MVRRVLRRWERLALAVAAVMVVAGGGVSALADEADGWPFASTVSAAPTGTDGPRAVTLVTGDRVVADPARRRYEFRAAPGREQMSYRSVSVGGRQFVIPNDAQVLVASGKLDLRLFDVTTLLEQGTSTSLLVTRDGAGTRREPVTTAEPAGRWAELTEPSAAASGARLGSRQLRAGVRTVMLDGPPPVEPRRAAAAEQHDLTFVFRNRDGAATVDASTLLVGIDDWNAFAFVTPGPDGTATTRLPKGRYVAESVVHTSRPGKDVPATSVIVNPELTVGTDARLEIDAAATRPISVTVPDPAAVGLGVFVSFRRSMGSGDLTSAHGSPDVTALFAAHDGPAVPDDQLDTAVSAFFARPGPLGTVTDSPMVYAGSWQQRGRLVTGFRKRVTEAELSTVRAEHGAVAPGRHATKSMVAELPLFRISSPIEYITTPFTRIERYAGTAQWANDFTEYAPSEDPDPWNREDLTSQAQSPTTYQPGQRYVERWNLGPFWPDPQVRRGGDTIKARPTLYGDAAGGREGTSAYQRAHVALYRDGHLVGESDRLDGNEFTVPAGTAGFRLTAQAERDFTELATRTSAAWTFSSAPVNGEFEKLPLLSVRFAPWVDLHSRAPSGRVVAMPVHVERGAPGTAVRSLTVEVSYDAGATWQLVPVTGPADRRVALVRHPAGPGLVSLRATATDAAGNTVEQTILNAYRLA
ncbi:hypothetical protein GCM10022225_83410 [Plantactinospora mayteni]|uniref:Peptidase n=1 Tax=Plantactinospora mayteni TaxID=566021 RepID=A0ABQ4F4C2_9ACTN|nr:hypothetical protein [Plantactinospora mayteni]GIH01764.1 hypothetical protein Pma05_83360 [Plantactinospora mayteni]